MKKNELNSEQFTRLLAAVAELPFIHSSRWETDYVHDVLQTVLDFHMQSTVVEDALMYFRNQVQRQHGIDDHLRLKTVLANFPDTTDGNKAASVFLWNNKHWTRTICLRRFLSFLESVGATDQVALRAWAQHAKFESDFKGQVKGLGIAVFQWLLLRCGVDTIKPDVWVINFVERVVGKKFPESVLVTTFEKIAPLVGETLETIDVTIWYYEKMAMTTADSPALRLVAWNLLKTGLMERLNADLSEFSWNVVLDERSKLRYEQAGLIMTPDRSLFGETAPGETTVSLLQSNWSEGLRLKLSVRHETSLPEDLFVKLQERLTETGWQLKNDSVFEANIRFEDDMMMATTMSYEELAEEVAEMIEINWRALRHFARKTIETGTEGP